MSTASAHTGISTIFKIIFVTHDLRAARMLCDRIAVMKAGEIVETGSSEDVFERPESEYTKKLISAMPGGSSNDQ